MSLLSANPFAPLSAADHDANNVGVHQKDECKEEDTTKPQPGRVSNKNGPAALLAVNEAWTPLDGPKVPQPASCVTKTASVLGLRPPLTSGKADALFLSKGDTNTTTKAAEKTAPKTKTTKVASHKGKKSKQLVSETLSATKTETTVAPQNTTVKPGKPANTGPCRAFLLGKCTFSPCKFEHVAPAVEATSSVAAQPAPLVVTDSKTCRYFTAGDGCRYGAVCKYTHDKSEKITQSASAVAALPVPYANVRETRNCYWTMSSASLKTMSRLYPNIDLVAEPIQKPHEHPILNMERAWAEEFACEHLLSVLKVKKIRLSVDMKVIDAGGNFSRHLSKKRGWVHCCNPILSSSDVFRHFKTPAVSAGSPCKSTTGCDCNRGHSCKHTGQSCDCYDIAAYLAVDSIYYMEPQVIANCVARSRCKYFVSVHHRFDDAYGAFADGEATYQLVSPTTVKMSVRGNSSAYVHSHLGWMRENHALVQVNGVAKFLIWNKLRSYACHEVMAFTLTEPTIYIDKPMSHDLLPVLVDPNHYGTVALGGALTDAGIRTVGGDILTLPDTVVHSWGSSVIIFQKATDTTMLVAKSLITAAANFSVNIPRTPESFKTLIAFMKSRVKLLNIPDDMVAKQTFAASCLGFIQNVAFETATLHGVVAPLLPTIAAHTEARSFNFQTVWTWKRAAAAIVAATAITAAAGAAVASGVGAVGLPTISAYAAAAYASSAVLTIGGVVVAAKLSGPSGVGRGTKETGGESSFPSYVTNRTSLAANTTTRELPAVCRLPATDPKKSVDDLLGSIDPATTLTVEDSSTNREVPGEGPLFAAGIVSGMSIPLIPSNSAHSTIAAVVQRVLKPTPFSTGQVNKDTFQAFRTWVLQGQNIEEAFGISDGETIPILTFEEWNSSYSDNQRRVHIKAYTSMDDSQMTNEQIATRSVFTKIEALSKGDCLSEASFTPRAIQSGTPEHNVITGPFCKSFSKHLAKRWDVEREGTGLKYTSGASLNAIGRAAARAARALLGRLAIIEGDFVKFDSSLHAEILKLEADIFKILGCTEKTFRELYQSVKTKGRDKFRNRYTVDGGRHSGDHQTSGGNSMLQGLAIVFAFALYDQRLNPLSKPLSFSETIEKYELYVLLLGDDNHISLPADVAAVVPLTQILLELGLELEPVYHYGDNALEESTFCSARFYPVVDQHGVETTTLAVGIGRGIARSGWLVNPPAQHSLTALIKGDALGRIHDCGFVPFVGDMWKKVLALTDNVAAKNSESMSKEQTNKQHVSSDLVFSASQATFAMVQRVYGLTEGDLEMYKSQLNSVTRLPAHVDYAPLRRAMEKDGMVPQTHESQLQEFVLPASLDFTEAAASIYAKLAFSEKRHNVSFQASTKKNHIVPAHSNSCDTYANSPVVLFPFDL